MGEQFLAPFIEKWSQEFHLFIFYLFGRVVEFYGQLIGVPAQSLKLTQCTFTFTVVGRY